MGLKLKKLTLLSQNYIKLTYHLLSTGCDPIINGAIGSLYIADVPSIVTDAFMPKDRGTGKRGKKSFSKAPQTYQDLNIKKKDIYTHKNRPIYA